MNKASEMAMNYKSTYNIENKNCLELVGQFRDGKIRIPEIQRSFVWKTEDIKQLLESILSGRPIGSFILWKHTDIFPTIRDIPGVSKKRFSREEELDFLLDGQQRITTLHLSLKGEDKFGPEGKRQFNFKKIYINLKKKSNFIIMNASNKDIKKKHVVKFNSLVTASDKDDLITDEDINRQKFHLNLTKGNVAITHLNNGVSLEEARIIFNLANTTGVDLTTFEIMNLLTYREESVDKQRFLLNERYEKTKKLFKKNEEYNYKNINSQRLLELISLIISEKKFRETNQGRNCSPEYMYSLNRNDFIETYKTSERYLLKAMDFVAKQYCFYSSDSIPYEASLVSVAYFLYKLKRKTKQTSINDLNIKDYHIHFMDFFFRRCLSKQRYGGSGSVILKDVDYINDILNDRIPGYNEHMALELSVKMMIERGKDFKKSSPFKNTILGIYRSIDPRFLGDYNKHVMSFPSVENHHFFQKEWFKNSDVTSELDKKHFDNSLIDNVVNIILLESKEHNSIVKNTSPEEYLPKFDNPNIKNVLRTHLIPENSEDITEDYEKFLLKRSNLIINKIRGLVLSHEIDKIHDTKSEI